MSELYHISVKTLDGNDEKLEKYRGQVLLIVNTASKCGFTPQYNGLQKLYDTYRDRGFSVLGFPCNQFGNQEPGDADEIRSFCSTNYHVTFPLYAKIEVNGSGAHPLYVYLCSKAPGILGTQSIKWNFTKFLVDRTGQVLRRFAPNDEPEKLADSIEAALNG